MKPGDAVVLTAEARKRFPDIGTKVGQVKTVTGSVVSVTWRDVGVTWLRRASVELV